MKCKKCGGEDISTSWHADKWDCSYSSRERFKVPEKEKGELLGVLGPMKPQIVGQ